jgi:molybdate transport system substrate-binding protein
MGLTPLAGIARTAVGIASPSCLRWATWPRLATALRQILFVAITGMCAPHAQADTLAVAVAANLQTTFAELQSAFENQSGHKLQPSFNASGRLVTQITLGAPFDVFLSADMAFPQALQKAGFAATRPAVYANGVLVLWSAKTRVPADWQQWLAGSAVRRIAIANPETAPYGREALRTLEHYGLRTLLQPKLVFAESIAQTNQYVYAQTVDAGLTAKSVVLSAAMRGVGSWIEIPAEAYQPIAQGVVVTSRGQREHPRAAQQFVDFLLSAAGRAILARSGYGLP